jgi:hypothetical protein
MVHPEEANTKRRQASLSPNRNSAEESINGSGSISRFDWASPQSSRPSISSSRFSNHQPLDKSPCTVGRSTTSTKAISSSSSDMSSPRLSPTKSAEGGPNARKKLAPPNTVSESRLLLDQFRTPQPKRRTLGGNRWNPASNTILDSAQGNGNDSVGAVDFDHVVTPSQIKKKKLAQERWEDKIASSNRSIQSTGQGPKYQGHKHLSSDHGQIPLYVSHQQQQAKSPNKAKRISQIQIPVWPPSNTGNNKSKERTADIAGLVHVGKRKTEFEQKAKPGDSDFDPETYVPEHRKLVATTVAPLKDPLLTPSTKFKKKEPTSTAIPNEAKSLHLSSQHSYSSSENDVSLVSDGLSVVSDGDLEQESLASQSSSDRLIREYKRYADILPRRTAEIVKNTEGDVDSHDDNSMWSRDYDDGISSIQGSFVFDTSQKFSDGSSQESLGSFAYSDHRFDVQPSMKEEDVVLRRPQEKRTSYRIRYEGPIGLSKLKRKMPTRQKPTDSKAVPSAALAAPFQPSPRPVDRLEDSYHTTQSMPKMPKRRSTKSIEDGDAHDSGDGDSDEEETVTPDLWITPKLDSNTEHTLWSIKRVWTDDKDGESKQHDDEEHSVHDKDLYTHLRRMVGVSPPVSPAPTKDGAPQVPRRNWKVKKFVEVEGKMDESHPEEEVQDDHFETKIEGIAKDTNTELVEQKKEQEAYVKLKKRHDFTKVEKDWVIEVQEKEKAERSESVLQDPLLEKAQEKSDKVGGGARSDEGQNDAVDAQLRPDSVEESPVSSKEEIGTEETVSSSEKMEDKSEGVAEESPEIASYTKSLPDSLSEEEESPSAGPVDPSNVSTDGDSPKEALDVHMAPDKVKEDNPNGATREAKTIAIDNAVEDSSPINEPQENREPKEEVLTKDSEPAGDEPAVLESSDESSHMEKDPEVEQSNVLPDKLEEYPHPNADNSAEENSADSPDVSEKSDDTGEANIDDSKTASSERTPPRDADDSSHESSLREEEDVLDSEGELRSSVVPSKDPKKKKKRESKLKDKKEKEKEKKKKKKDKEKKRHSEIKSPKRSSEIKSPRKSRTSKLKSEDTADLTSLKSPKKEDRDSTASEDIPLWWQTEEAKKNEEEQMASSISPAMSAWKSPQTVKRSISGTETPRTLAKKKISISAASKQRKASSTGKSSPKKSPKKVETAEGDQAVKKKMWWEK